MAFLRWKKRPKKSIPPAASGPSPKVPPQSMALAGAVSAMNHSKPSTNGRKEKIVRTGGQLDQAAVVRPKWSTNSDKPGVKSTSSPPSAERLIYLLSKLPYEIRLNIYELCIPCMWHRKRRILLDYIADCKWMATAPMIFGEAAPLALVKSIPYIYTRLDEGETLAGVFNKHVARAFPADTYWALPTARSMVEKLAVTIRDPFLYRHSDVNALAERLAAYFNNLKPFENLKTLYISLGPDYLPILFGNGGGVPHFPPNWNGEIEDPIIKKLEQSAMALSKVIPSTCNVVWRFDRAGMPTVPGYLRGNNQAILKYLEGINWTMEKSWNEEMLLRRIANMPLITADSAS